MQLFLDDCKSVVKSHKPSFIFLLFIRMTKTNVPEKSIILFFDVINVVDQSSG